MEQLRLMMTEEDAELRPARRWQRKRRPWELDQRTRAIGLSGVRRARAVLGQRRSPEHPTSERSEAA